MAAQISIEPLDTPVIEQTNFGPDQDRWLSNIVDIINANLTTIQNALNTLFAVGQTDIGGGGAGPIVVPVTGMTASNYVNVKIVSTTNANVAISNVTAGVGNFSITFDSDPGASAIIVYQGFVSQP